MNKKSITAIIALLFFGSIVWVYTHEVQRLLSTPPTSWTEDYVADCAIVLTGGPYRIQEGFDLLVQKRVKKLIFSGVHPTSELHEIFPLWSLYGNLHKEDVILEKHSKTTYGNAQQSFQLAQALQCGDVILVTSRLHMYRAFMTFKAIFSSEIPIYKQTVIAKRLNPKWSDVFVEASKSIFYSLWAY